VSSVGPQYVVAIDVGGTSLKGSVVDGDGHALSLERRPTRAADGPEAVIDAVLALAADLAADAPRTGAVGLALPGVSWAPLPALATTCWSRLARASVRQW
jgi:glucokinase